MQMDVHKTPYHFYTTKKIPSVTGKNHKKNISLVAIARYISITTTYTVAVDCVAVDCIALNY